MLRYRLRLLAVALTSWLPTKLLRGFLKSFEMRQDLAEAAGYNVYPRCFYSPIPEVERIDWPRLRARRNLPGIDLNIPGALDLVSRLARHTSELDNVPYDRPGGAGFWFNNDSFTD